MICRQVQCKSSGFLMNSTKWNYIWLILFGKMKNIVFIQQDVLAEKTQYPFLLGASAQCPWSPWRYASLLAYTVEASYNVFWCILYLDYKCQEFGLARFLVHRSRRVGDKFTIAFFLLIFIISYISSVVNGLAQTEYRDPSCIQYAIIQS